MKWFGVGLAMVSAIVALVAGFHYHNLAWSVGGIVFLVIGLFIVAKS